MSTLICESCHSILYNIGDGSLEGGYYVNLLLQNYEETSMVGITINVNVGDSFGANVGSGLCVACHNQNKNDSGCGSSNGLVSPQTAVDKDYAPANMHPLTGWTVTRAVDAGRSTTTLVISGAETHADASGAPNNASYPAANEMDCDSCHVPHGADPYNIPAVNGKFSVPAILNSPNSTLTDYAGLCQECHNM